MALYPRIIGLEEPKIPVHAFYATAGEFARGHITGVQARTLLGLSVAEAIEAQTLVNRVVSGALSADEVHAVLLMAEAGLHYTTEASIKARLGV